MMAALDGPEAGQRTLLRMQVGGGQLVRLAEGGDFAVLPRGDRRRRPLMRVAGAIVSALAAQGALEEIEPGMRFKLSAAGRDRLIRLDHGEEGYRAQHDALVDRPVIDPDGDVRVVRGVDSHAPLARLEKLSDPEGKSFLSPGELEAAHRLRADWEAGQAGTTHGSDWRAPPRGNSPRGPGGAEHAHAGALDARRRFERALASLAPMLAHAVRAACLWEQGMADIERMQRWPSRSGKLALKLGLAQLAEHYREAR